MANIGGTNLRSTTDEFGTLPKPTILPSLPTGPAKINPGISLPAFSPPQPLPSGVTDFERGERAQDGQEVRRSTITQSPISFEILRRPILAPGRGSRRAPGFIGTLDEELDFFDPVVAAPAPTPTPATEPGPRLVQPLDREGNPDRLEGGSGGPNAEPGAATSAGAPSSGSSGVGSGVGGAPGPGDAPDTGFGSAQGPGGDGGGGGGAGVDSGGRSPGGMGSEPGEGGAGSAGGEDKIICTELYRQGLLTLQERQFSYRGTMTLCRPVTLRGYHFWAMPVVRALRRRRWRAFWTFVTRHRARELAFRLGLRDRPDRIGQAMRVLFEPISFAIGVMLELADRMPDVGSLYDHQYPRI